MQITGFKNFRSTCLLRGAAMAIAMACCSSMGIDAVQTAAADTETAATWKTAALSNIMIPMRDGTRLAADVYVPSHDGVTPAPARFPVLLMRTPYGKKVVANWPPTVASTGALTPEIATRQGYVVVFQDVRGTSDSEGVFEPMLNEGADGFDTVAWLEHQPWSNGRIGTFGPSYMGGTQMLLAAERPSGLVTAFSQVAATDQFKNDWVYMDGVLVGTAAWWSGFMLSGEGSAASHLKTAQQEALKTDLAVLGVADPKQVSPEIFEQLIDKAWKTLPLTDIPIARQASWWHAWLDNWDNPQHFQNNEMSGRFAKVAVPILHLGGWYDLFLRNTYEHYRNITTQAKDPAIRAAQRLVIGPWSHVSCGGCPSNSTVDARAMELAWMDQWLKGRKMGFFESPVILYVMGENRWRAEDSWPLAGTQRTRFYLHSTGGANTAKGDGVLSTSPPGKEQPDRFIYDPRDPAPTSGGVGLAGSRAVQNDAEARPDVLVYSTRALTEDVEVTGEVSATLHAASSARDTDWWMKLIDVDPDGKAYILCHGVVRARYRNSRTEPRPLTPGKIEKYAINLWATSNVFKKGHRIRVEVTSSNFPYADRNPNAFVDLSKATEKDFALASQTLYHEQRHPSYVELPLIPSSRARDWIATPFPVAASPATGK